ncbi:MAG: glutamate 5-kinase [Desulfovibrionaceae bacterium]|nr:glutamate 5-kinase [Desulfovibrionaceae bacterium]
MDWQAEKQAVMQQARCIVVKVGSAVLTNEHGLDLHVIKNLVKQLAYLHSKDLNVVLVSSGAVAAGRAVLREESSINAVPGKQAASAIGQSRLMHTYDQLFDAHGIISAQILLTRDDLSNRQRFLNARNTFSQLLSWGVIPVINENDTVAVQELLKFGDNDTLGSLLLNLVEADLFINLTTVGGVLGANPEKTAGATIMPCVEDVHALDLDELCGGKTSVGTGGMYSKLMSARRASQLGVPTLILPGKAKDVLIRAFEGEEMGTWIRANVRGISRRKFWMAYNQNVYGEVTVDEGAARALRSGGKSLLPAGVIAVEGDFMAGDLVRVVTADGDAVGAGLSNYSARELQAIMGRKLSDLMETNEPYFEAIHCDNLLIGAVV